jgi:hypothetical protein
LAFSLANITAGATRTLTVPDASGRIQVEGQPIGNTTPAAGSFTTLSANNGTLTASAPVLDLGQTWNASGTNFTGLRVNVTDTASAAASLLADLQVGGSSRVSVNKNGTIFASGVSSYVALGCEPNFISMDIVAGSNIAGSGTATRVRLAGRGTTGAIQLFALNGTEFRIDDNVGSGTTGARLIADATDTLAQRRSTNAQTFRIYNTYTDASNYERGFLRWSSNVLQIGSEKLGTGTARALEFQTDGTTRMTIAATNNAISCAGSLSVVTNLSFQGNSSIVGNIASGVIRLLNAASNGFDRLQFGGSTTSFPALKRSSTVLQSRLADDSDFAPLQGQIRIHQNAVSETITATHTLILYDAAGTAYKVPCVAA